MTPDTGDSKARSKVEPPKFVKSNGFTFFLTPPFPFPFREELRLISSLPLYLSKALLERLFHHPGRALGSGSVSAARGDSAVRSGFQPNLPPTATEGEEPARVCKHGSSVRGDGSCSSHNICLHCQSLVCAHTAPPSAARLPEKISPCNPFPACSTGSLACLFPIWQLAWHLCLSADLSSSRGQEHFGKPLREDGTIAFIHFIHKDDVMKGGFPLHCSVTPKPGLRLVWLCPVGQNHRGTGDRLAVQEQDAQRHPHLCWGLTAWGSKGRYLLCSLYLKAKIATLTYWD